MTINKGDFIKISYTGKMENGTVFDTTDEEVAKANNIYNENSRYGGDVIIIGGNQIIPGLEEEILTKDAGYEGTVSVPPEKGFGQHNPSLLRDLPLKRFDQTPVEGMQATVDGRIGIVVRVMGRHARIDFNSPMAGQTVTYDYKIEAVLTETKDKAVGLSTLYTGHEMDIEIDGGKARINVPIEYNYSQQWGQSKIQMALELLKYTDITDVQYIENYNRDLLKKPEEEQEESGED